MYYEVIRPFEIGQMVRVYLNIKETQKNKTASVFTIADAKSGLVLAYAENILLKNVQAGISKANYERTIRENRKRPHAWLIGEFVGVDIPNSEGLTNEIYYEPFTCPKFIHKASGEEFKKAGLAVFRNRRAYV